MANRDPRVPPTGTTIVRNYKERKVEVLVRADDFESDGASYKSLSALATKLAGCETNGFKFFNLGGKPRAAVEVPEVATVEAPEPIAA